jgi:hypothetical protein
MATDNPWAASSLQQTATPWRGDDEQRFNHGLQERRRSAFQLAVVLVVLIGGVCLAGWYVARADTRAQRDYTDLELIPRDAAGFVSVRAADLWQSPNSMNGVRAVFGLWLARVTWEALGVNFDDTERITLVFLQPPEPPAEVPPPPMIMPKKKKGGAPKQTAKKAPPAVVPSPSTPAALLPPDMQCWYLVATNKPFNPVPVFHRVVRNGPPHLHNRKTYYTPDRPEVDKALHIVNDRLFVVASRRAMLNFLDREHGQGAAVPLQTALHSAKQKKHLVVGLNLTGESRRQLAAYAGQFQAFKNLRPALAIEGGTLAMHDGQQPEMDVRLSFADVVQAEQARTALTGSFKQWESDTAGLQVPRRARETFKRMEELFRNTMIDVRGTNVRVVAGAARAERKLEAP